MADAYLEAVDDLLAAVADLLARSAHTASYHHFNVPKEALDKVSEAALRLVVPSDDNDVALRRWRDHS